MISEIERGSKSPTVSTLRKLANAMGVSVASLIEEGQEEPSRIHVKRWIDPKRPARTPRVDLSPEIPGSKLGLVRYTVPPRTMAGPFAAHAPGTIEHIHLLQGAVRITCGNDEVSLAAGDTCSCYTDVQHAFDNRKGRVGAVLLVVAEIK